MYLCWVVSSLYTKRNILSHSTHEPREDIYLFFFGFAAHYKKKIIQNQKIITKNGLYIRSFVCYNTEFKT